MDDMYCSRCSETMVDIWEEIRGEVRGWWVYILIWVMKVWQGIWCFSTFDVTFSVVKVFAMATFVGVIYWIYQNNKFLPFIIIFIKFISYINIVINYKFNLITYNVYYIVIIPHTSYTAYISITIYYKCIL